MRVLMKAASDTNAENAALGNEITELLNIIKFDVKNLPADIREGSQTAAAILKAEGLPSVDETALTLCLEQKKMQTKMKNREERLLKAWYNSAFSKYNSLEEKLAQIRKEIGQINDTLQSKMANDENAESDRILWSNRLRDYKGAIDNLEEELDTLQSRDIGLDNTLQKSSMLMNKLSELTEINTELERYDDLPPNLLQAKNALERKKRELEEIDNLIHEKMSE